MSKIWYNRTTGDGAVFDDAEDMSNWPDFQEAKPTPTALTEEQLTEQVRAERNELLTTSDWTQVDDSPVDKSAWVTYRQLLRDVPSQAGFPTNITWPTKPE